jgi:type I restriction enzyme S subunit
MLSKHFFYQLRLISPGGAGRNRVLNKSDFLKLQILLPPLPEQRRIAEILGTWDQAITLTEQLIAAKQRRKKALMQQLLTGRQRFREFEGEEWHEVKLKDVATINPPKPGHLTEDTLISFIGMADVSEDAKLINTVDRPYGAVKNGFTSFKDTDVLVAKITPCLYLLTD